MGEIVPLSAAREAAFRAGRMGPRATFVSACLGRIRSAEHHLHLDAVAIDLLDPPASVTDADLAALQAEIAGKRRKIGPGGPPEAA